MAPDCAALHPGYCHCDHARLRIPAAIGPRHDKNFRPGGRGECRVPMHPQPRVRMMEAHEQVTTGTPETPGIPARNGWNGFLRALLGDEFLLPPSSANMACQSPVGPTRLRGLGISNGCQDHTTSPYADASFVLRAVASLTGSKTRPAITCAPDAAASTASRTTFVTIAIRPSLGRDVGVIKVIWF
jgi:hypothetical protein